MIAIIALALLPVDLHRVKQAPAAFTPAPRTTTARPSDAGPTLGIAAVLALHIADVETSQYDLRVCECRETNPLSRNRWLAYGVGVPFDVVGYVWARRSHRDHPRDRSWLIPTIAGAGVHTFGLYMNMRALENGRRLR